MTENKLYIQGSIANSLPSMVKNELSKMSAQKQEEFVEEYQRKRKSVGLAYVFMLFLFGSHYGYLRQWGTQRLFRLTGGGILIWSFIDLFRLPGLVKNANKEVAIEVMRNLKAISH